VTGTEDELARQLRLLFIKIAPAIKTPQPKPMNDVSMYIANNQPPAFIYYRKGLCEHQKLLAIVHELTHACLTRPGSGGDEEEYERQEPCSNQAAAVICSTYGISDYRKVMRSLTVPAYRFHGGDPTTIELMIERVGTALEQPGVFPEWANPI